MTHAGTHIIESLSAKMYAHNERLLTDASTFLHTLKLLLVFASRIRRMREQLYIPFYRVPFCCGLRQFAFACFRYDKTGR